MDNSNCYWCDYPIDLIGTKNEGYYCTFDPSAAEKCQLDIPCVRYCAADNMPDYIRHLIEEYRRMEQLFIKLP